MGKHRKPESRAGRLKASQERPDEGLVTLAMARRAARGMNGVED